MCHKINQIQNNIHLDTILMIKVDLIEEFMIENYSNLFERSLISVSND